MWPSVTGHFGIVTKIANWISKCRYKVLVLSGSVCVRLRDRHCSWWQKCQRVKLPPPPSPPSTVSLPSSLSLFSSLPPHHSMLLCTVQWCPAGPEIAMDMMWFLVSLSDVMCCSPGLWWTCLATFGRHVILYTPLLSFYHCHLFLSITDYVCMDAWSSDSMIDWFGGVAFRGQATLQVDIQLHVDAEEVMQVKNILYRLIRIVSLWLTSWPMKWHVLR